MSTIQVRAVHEEEEKVSGNPITHQGFLAMSYHKQVREEGQLAALSHQGLALSLL